MRFLLLAVIDNRGTGSILKRYLYRWRGRGAYELRTDIFCYFWSKNQ